MDQPIRKRRIRIAALWLLFLAAAGFLIFRAEYRSARSRTEQLLAEQTRFASENIPDYIKNDQSAWIVEQTILSQLETLSFAMEGRGEPAAEKEFLDAYCEAAGLAQLAVFDRDGSAVYTSPGYTPPDGGDPAAGADSLPLQEGSGTGDNWNLEDASRSDWFRSGQEQTYSRKIADRWTAVVRSSPTELQIDFETNLNWARALQRLQFGHTGFAVAVSTTNGTVLSHPDSLLIGAPFGELEILRPDGKPAAAPEDLRLCFPNPGAVAEVTMAGERYLAALTGVGAVQVTAMIPEQEVRDEAFADASLLFFLVFVATGLCFLYVFFHLREAPGEEFAEGKRFFLDKALRSGLVLITVLSVACVLLLGTYLAALSAYASTYRHTQSQSIQVARQMISNDDTIRSLQEWTGGAYLKKGLSARCVLENAAEGTVTRDYLRELAERLNVSAIHLFDSRGNLLATDSEYDRIRLEEDSPFRELLQGKPFLVGEYGKDPLFGTNVQKIGVTLRDGAGQSKGFLMLTVSSPEMDTLYSHLTLDWVFHYVSGWDGTAFLIVDTDSMTIVQSQEVWDGRLQTGFYGADLSGVRLAAFSPDADKLKDGYNGTFRFMEDNLFTSVGRYGDFWYLLMHPVTPLSLPLLAPVICAAAAVLLLMLLMFPAACLVRKKPGALPEPAPVPDAGGIVRAASSVLLQGEFFSMLSGLLYKSKLFFEDRWPQDCRPWKDKSRRDKFAFCARVFLLLTFAAVAVVSLLPGRDSVWFYAMNGTWNVGVNLHFVTSCLITISLLLVSRMVLHKLLYWTARAVEARGETICHLLDSFLRYILFFVGIFVCLFHLGVNIEALSVAGGAIGMIVSFGCQSIVSDILAGILMVFEGVARVGDLVCYNGAYGFILSVGVRTTRLMFFGEVTIVRNNEFKNYVFRQEERQTRLSVPLRVDLKESLQRVEGILEKELPEINRRLRETFKCEIAGPSYASVDKINESNVELKFYVFCPGRGDVIFALNRAVNRELKLMCERNGITLAMPQVVVNEPSNRPEKKPDTAEE